jgi:SpoVK/Ycf46/Vps4 family AAA+-type ATPase
VLGKPADLSSSSIVKELLDMIGLDDVKQSVLSLHQMSMDNYNSELCGEGVLDISLHRMFIGNPGTGKTTIAKLYGRILAEMGYLSNGEVIVVGASKLTGSAVGATATIVNNLLDSVKGKVCFRNI